MKLFLHHSGLNLGKTLKVHVRNILWPILLRFDISVPQRDIILRTPAPKLFQLVDPLSLIRGNIQVWDIYRQETFLILKIKINLNIIQIFSSYRPVNTHRLGYKANRLMTYREIIAVFSEIHKKPIIALCGPKVRCVNVKLVVHKVTTGL